MCNPRTKYSIYLFDVELEPVPHEERQLHEQHVPAKVVEGVRNDDGPERERGEDGLPWYRTRCRLGKRVLI